MDRLRRAVGPDRTAVAAEAGGNVIDTADVSTNGTSETILGELLKGRRDRFVLGTNFTNQTDPGNPNSAGNHRKKIVTSLEASLRRPGACRPGTRLGSGDPGHRSHRRRPGHSRRDTRRHAHALSSREPRHTAARGSAARPAKLRHLSIRPRTRRSHPALPQTPIGQNIRRYVRLRGTLGPSVEVHRICRSDGPHFFVQTPIRPSSVVLRARVGNELEVIGSLALPGIPPVPHGSLRPSRLRRAQRRCEYQACAPRRVPDRGAVRCPIMGKCWKAGDLR